MIERSIEARVSLLSQTDDRRSTQREKSVRPHTIMEGLGVLLALARDGNDIPRARHVPLAGS